MAVSAAVADTGSGAQHRGSGRGRRDLDDYHRPTVGLADEPHRSPRARVLEHRRGAAAGDPVVYRRRGDGRRVWAARHAAIGDGAAGSRAAALDLWIYRLLADSDPVHLSLRL